MAFSEEDKLFIKFLL